MSKRNQSFIDMLREIGTPFDVRDDYLTPSHDRVPRVAHHATKREKQKIHPEDYGPQEDYRVEDSDFVGMSVIWAVSKAALKWFGNELGDVDRMTRVRNGMTQHGFIVPTKNVAAITRSASKLLMSWGEYQFAMEDMQKQFAAWQLEDEQ